MNKWNARLRKIAIIWVCALGVATVLSGCPSSNSTDSPSPPRSSGGLPDAMVSSTLDSGLMLTVGIPRGDIAKPNGNPIALSTVPDGASAAPAGYTRTQQDDPAVSYSGNWVIGISTDYSDSSAAESVNAGDTLRYNFNGRSIRWFGRRGPDTGVANVYIDGMFMGTTDTYSSSPKSRVVLFSASGLNPGGHSLMLQVQGQHNAASTSSAVWVDGFDVSGQASVQSQVPAPEATGSGTSRVEQDDAAVAYSGSWSTVSSVPLVADYSGGTAATASSSGAQATLTFTGTGVSWIGYEDTLSGIADVILDGSVVSNVDSYSLTPASQVVLYSTTGLPNTRHTLTIRATGGHQLLALGSKVTVDAFDVQAPLADTTPPSVSMTAPANGATVSGTVTVSATASDNVGVASVQFELDGAALGSRQTSAPYSISWDTTSVANGSHSLTAVASDATGNHTTATAVSVTVKNVTQPPPDITPPSVSMTAPANGATVSGSVSVTADASDNVGVAGVQFLLDGGALGSEDSSAPYAVNWNTANVSNGTHRLSAVARDTSGNTTTSATVTVTVSNGPPPDTTPPTVSMTAPTNGATVSGSVTVSASASDNVGVAGVQFLLDGAALGTEDTSAPYSISWDSTSVANGSHRLTAVARDAAGNHSTATAVTVTVNNQTQPPPDTTPPSVSMTGPADGSTVSGNVTVSASASDNVGVTGVQFKLDGANLGSQDTAAPYSVTWNSSGVANGSHTLTAVARDAAGNSTTATPVTVTVDNGPPPDTTPPTVSMTAPANGATVSGSVTLSADASDNVAVAGVQFQLDGANLGAEDTASPYSLNWNTSTASNGTHSLRAVARDTSGNISTSAAVTVTVNNGGGGGDTTPPTVSMTAPANGASVSGSISVSANASDNVGVAGVQFMLDGAALGGEDTSSPYSITWNTSAAANGSHTLTAVARDAAGNHATSAPVTVTVNNGGGGDTTPPTVSMTSPGNGSTVSGSVTVTASASDNVGVTGVQFQLDGTGLGAEDTSAPYSISWNTTSASDGTHSLRAIARDAAGNRTTSAPVTVTVSNGGGGGNTTRIEQDNPAVAYTGTWVTASDSSVSGGSAAESNQANATATVKFTGTGITWIGYKCGCAAGFANVSVDGGAPTQVDNYSATTQPQAPVFSVSNLPKGNHTLKITVTGTYDRNGQTAYVVVDAFDITN